MVRRLKKGGGFATMRTITLRLREGLVSWCVLQKLRGRCKRGFTLTELTFESSD